MQIYQPTTVRKINLTTLFGTHFEVTVIEDKSVVKIYNINTFNVTLCHRIILHSINNITLLL